MKNKKEKKKSQVMYVVQHRTVDHEISHVLYNNELWKSSLTLCCVIVKHRTLNLKKMRINFKGALSFIFVNGIIS